jgi:hypothetical protein
MINPSRATIVAPAVGPKRMTDVKTKVSEIEIVAGTDGSLTVAEPLRSVSAARVSHWPVSLRPSGPSMCFVTSTADSAITLRPATITKAT